MKFKITLERGYYHVYEKILFVGWCFKSAFHDQQSAEEYISGLKKNKHKPPPELIGYY